MKTLLAAVAKNEAAYLPEWIYHHLRLGFSSVWVYVNKTEDNSREILEKIAAKYPVRCCEADHLLSEGREELSAFLHPEFEANNPLQSRAFADIFIKARQEGFTHVAYFDIDEFLCLACEDINAYLSSIDSFGAKLLKIKWFQCDGDEEAFSLALKPVLTGKKQRNVKMVVSTELSDFCFKTTHHVISTKKRDFAYLAGKGMLLPNESHMRYPEDWTDDAFLMHRVFRSKKEYLANIYNGANIKNNSRGLKMNRPGWKVSRKNVIELDPTLVKEYEVGYDGFLRECLINQELKVAQDRVFESAEKVESIYLHLVDEAEKLSAVMAGTGLPRLVVER